MTSVDEFLMGQHVKQEPSLKAKHIAKEFNLNLRTVYKMAARGVIPSEKLGRAVRFKWSKVQTAIERRSRHDEE